MNREKELSLDRCHKDFLEICLGEFPIDRVNERVSEKITGLGTKVNEKIQSLDQFINYITGQRKAAEGIDTKPQFTGVSKTRMADGAAAAFVDEVTSTVVAEGVNSQLNLRLTSIFEYADNQWRAVHFHTSLGQSAEGTEASGAAKERNEELEQIIADKTNDLAEAIEELKATRTQLLTQEKLAALGRLAAGIAHEIKNPMNFVNNFSELSLEYVEEIRAALTKLPQNDATGEIEDLVVDVANNLKKIHQHGTRADGILKSMLLHSRGGSGVLEPTDINELLREYVNLAFHGMRAGKKPINVKINCELSEDINNVPVYPEDFSRVVLNLCKNAFDAMRDKAAQAQNGTYLPSLFVKSSVENERVRITFEDNGPGIPEEIRNKLFEPFFTTKKGTEGTGLGLSITNDIIKNHKGMISLDSKPDSYTRFTIELPLTNETKAP